MNQSKKDFLFGLFFQPVRIVSILIILPLFLPIEFSWQTAQWFFYGFGILFPSSFFVESIFRLDKHVLFNSLSVKQNMFKIFKSLYPKYEQNFSLEFVSVAVFALLSFSSDKLQVFSWTLLVLAITTSWQVFTEFHHAKLVPILNKIEMSEKTKILLFIPIVVFTVFFLIGVYMFIDNRFEF